MEKYPGDKSADNEVTDKVIEFPDADTVEEQAARWISRLETDQPDEATVAEFKQWFRQSPEHRAAFEKHKALWDDMNILARMMPPASTQARPAPQPAMALWWKRGLAFCAVIAVAIALQFAMGPDGRYSTAVGEQKTVRLDDGTSILMNTDTAIHVDYSRTRRAVYLERGEAYFTVARDTERPFEVHAGEGKVRAVGTAFTVYLRSDDVEVVVTDGTVEILPMPAEREAEASANAGHDQPATQTAKSGQTPAQVKAGNIATYDRYTAEHVMQKALTRADEKLSWQEGMLVFRGEPLERIIAEVNRYTKIRIVIPEQQVRALKVSGFFEIDDINSVFEALEEGFNIHAKFVSDNLVYLESREEQ